MTYGERTQPQVGVRRLLANACVMQRVCLCSHFVSFRNISQNCPMPSSPVNVTFCPSTSIRYCKRVRFKGQRTQPLKFGDPAGYCVLAGKRSKQAKDKQTNKLRLFGQTRSLRRGVRKTLAFFRATHFLSLRAEIMGPRGILCTRGEKAQTSKRVSVIACDNVISKAKFAP